MNSAILEPVDVPIYTAQPRRTEAGKPLPRGSTPRIHRLAVRAATRRRTRWVEVPFLAGLAPQDLGNSHANEAARFVHILTHATPSIHDGELIVGAWMCAREDEENAFTVWKWEPDGFEYEVANLAKTVPPELTGPRTMAERGLISPVGAQCHKVADYSAFIRTGSQALARRARELAQTRTGEARDFTLAFAEGHEAMIRWAHGYSRECQWRANICPDPARAAELHEITRICQKVPALPAETFHEAIQSFWFAYLATGFGDVGRLDQILHDFYVRDMEAGRITREQALELVESLLIKLHDDWFEHDVNVSSVHTMTLGGLTPEGRDATNDLTILILEAMRNVRLSHPTVYLRCHAGTPEDVLRLAVTLQAEGLSHPSFYGDKPIVDGLVRLGVPVEQARDYALGGCTEVVSPGRGNWGAPTGWINLAMLADDALRDAARRGIRNLTGLFGVFEQHLAPVLDACTTVTETFDRLSGLSYAYSLFMPCCLERGADVGKGGAESYMAQWVGVGLPNAADMFGAADALAFRGGADLSSVLASLDADDAVLRARVRALPKFGTAHPEPDAIANRLLCIVADAVEKCSTPLRTRFAFGHLSGGQNMHIDYGRIMGPTLDGRRAGQALADSLAGVQGCAAKGPTSLIRSLCALDHSRMQAGNVSTLMLNRDQFRGGDGIRQIAALIRTFVNLGGSQLQFNLVDAATLRKAQAEPDAYRGLMIRVAGYSADFTRTGQTLQNEIIARIEGLH